MLFSAYASNNTSTSTANTTMGHVEIHIFLEGPPAIPQITREQKQELLDELKRRYHKLAHQHHPDLGGSEEKMKRLNAWYEDNRAKIEALRVA